MNNETKNAQGMAEAVAKVRESYAPPSLKVFGTVGALTQSGTQGVDEQKSGQGNPNRMA